MENIPHYKSFSSYELTYEQRYAVHLAVSRGDNLKINAFAGTGKTSTLRAIAANLSHQRILYLAFNKTVQQEASLSFPSNVQTRTIHSLAYHAMGMRDPLWQQKLSKRMLIRDYADALGITISGKLVVKAIFCLREAIRVFQQTQDLCPGAKHIPESEFMYLKKTCDKDMIKQFVEDKALILWHMMTNPHVQQMGIQHDTYLKMWQLSKPQLDQFDMVLLDEAQDTNHVTISILSKQKNRLILVGDSWQQIYAFRGAVNAMEVFETPMVCYLTQSFRFGPEFADLANQVLQLRSATQKIKGTPEKQSSLGKFDTPESCTVIFRYNIELLEEAIQLASKGFRLFIVGSIEKTAALMTDVYYLFACEKKKIRDKRVKGVKDWFELESNLDLIGDLELVKSFRFVERYQLETPKLLRNIQQACVSEHSANIILTTGHKSKGRQWDCVRISKDFYDALKTGESEELNLLYVAITRASKHLDVPSYILKYVEKKQAQLPSQSLLQ